MSSTTDSTPALIARLAAAPEADQLELAHALVARLESPREALQRIAWAEAPVAGYIGLRISNTKDGDRPAARHLLCTACLRLTPALQPARYAALRTAVDLRLFEHLAAAPGASAAALAERCGAEAALLARLLSHLAAMNAVREEGSDGFANGPLGAALVEPKFRDGIVYNFDVALPAQMALPTFLRDTRYVDPVNPVAGPFQAAHNTDAHFFGWVGARPQYLSAFGNWMAGYSAGRMNWGGFPAATALAGVPDDDVLLVDVGGGQGHDLAEFRAAFPGLTGKLILQDVPDVVAAASATLPAGVSAMPHDFFTPQPVRAARVYHLHSVLHDWPADDCVRILAALKPALGPASRILVNELVVPPRKADWRVTGMDLLMMVLGSVRERTEAEWREIVQRAGLRVLRVWYGDAGRESLIEVALPE